MQPLISYRVRYLRKEEEEAEAEDCVFTASLALNNSATTTTISK